MKKRFLCILTVLLLLLSGCSASREDIFSDAYENYFDGEVQIVLERANTAVSLSESVKLAEQYVTIKNSEEKTDDLSTIYTITFSTTSKDDLERLIRSFENISGWKETIYKYWAMRKKISEAPPSSFYEEDDKVIACWYPEQNHYFISSLEEFKELPITSFSVYGVIAPGTRPGYPGITFYVDSNRSAVRNRTQEILEEKYGFDDSNSGTVIGLD